MILACLIAVTVNSIVGLFTFLLAFSSGFGIVHIYPIASPAAGPPAIGEADPTVIDGMLADRFNDTPEGQRLEVLVRFDDAIERADRQVLDDLGIEMVGEFRMLPAAHVRATPHQVELLSGYPGVEWMEWDAPLD
ncbi:MAG: hypothetical protein LN414_03040, partial [Candidatus Thermoplasmatota archaeon]|nr:hypothetical protein [Candidatus Thermoplasmatota archaeon]